MLLGAPDARAGYYSGPVYSGGTYIKAGTSAKVNDYAVASGAWGAAPAVPYGCVPGTQQVVSGTASCGDAINATFTWIPDPKKVPDPPPPYVLVTETYTAGWIGTNYLGAAATGSPGASGASALTWYSLQTGAASISTSRTLTSSMTGTGSVSAKSVYTGLAIANYSVSVSPFTPTLNLGGTTKDSSGNYNILVGQQCTSSLSGLPGGTGWTTTYQWGVTGTTFQSWTVSTDALQSHTTEVDGPGRSDQPTAQWYYNDNLGSGKSKVEQVFCTATVTPPTGQGAAFTVKVSQPITVWVPAWSCTGIGGGMYIVNTGTAASPNYSIKATSNPGTTQVGGMDWDALITSPLSGLFGNGIAEIVQLVIPGNTFQTDYSYYYSTNGEEGLDTVYPQPQKLPATNLFIGSDSPGFPLNIPLADRAANFAQSRNQFYDCLLFTPPGSSQCVPLAQLAWSTDGNATEPFVNNVFTWAAYGAASAGSVNPTGSGNNSNFQPTNSFPAWTQNSGNGIGQWEQQ